MSEKIETTAVHGGERRPGPEGSVVYPIFQGTVYGVEPGTAYGDRRVVQADKNVIRVTFADPSLDPGNFIAGHDTTGPARGAAIDAGNQPAAQLGCAAVGEWRL